MGKPSGFLEHDRELPRRRPVPVRLRDWKEVYEPYPMDHLDHQAGRCMDCGIPFCHEGCPLGNLIPEWNDLVYRDDWATAIDRLHATNNFPEFTGRLCPAPCEGACVLGINQQPVTIERIEYEIIERAFQEGWVQPQLPVVKTTKRVAVVGSGPAGLAAAQQLARAGHDVVVFERAARPGGLLRYGIPEFKMEKAVVDRRLAQMEAEGVEFRCLVSVGSGPAPDGAVSVSVDELRKGFEAIVLAGGSTVPRDLHVVGRELRGIHVAMEYLGAQNQVCEGSLDETPISAAGKRVVIIGGGDTGADCLGTAHRHGARSVVQLEIMEQPDLERAADNPWPQWPVILRTSSAHEEGGERRYSVETTAFIDDGQGAVSGIRIHEIRPAPDGRGFVPVPGSEQIIECELVLFAMGFVGTEPDGIASDLDVAVTPRGTVVAHDDWATSVPGVFVCGDMTRGQSLIVWAIAEGRSCAAGVDRYLMGDSVLPSPVAPGQLALR